MCGIRLKAVLIGSVMALTLASSVSGQTPETRPRGPCEASAPKTAPSLIDIEILTRAEQHAESLRAKLFQVEIQELEAQAVIEELDYWMSPEGVQRALAFVGSARPMDELRKEFQAKVENQKARVNKQLELLGANRERLTEMVAEADANLERVRQRLGTQ